MKQLWTFQAALYANHIETLLLRACLHMKTIHNHRSCTGKLIWCFESWDDAGNTSHGFAPNTDPIPCNKAWSVGKHTCYRPHCVFIACCDRVDLRLNKLILTFRLPRNHEYLEKTSNVFFQYVKDIWKTVKSNVIYWLFKSTLTSSTHKLKIHWIYSCFWEKNKQN